MNNFSLPFIIEYPNKKDYVLSKLYKEKKECYLLKISQNKKLSEPITINIKPLTTDLRFKLDVQIEKGSSVTIIEDWTSEVTSKVVHYENNITCKEDSWLNYIIINRSSDKTEITEARTSNISANAVCNIYSFQFGSTKTRSNLYQKASKGAQIDSNIITKSKSDQDLSYSCQHFYEEGDGRGEISMRGISDDKSKLSFNGAINIGKKGGGTRSYLSQDTLNLSPHATIKAVPGLNIDTNDVQTGHRASVRNLNDEDIHYFGTRGIDKVTARNLLITGFLKKEIKKIERWKYAHNIVYNLIKN